MLKQTQNKKFVLLNVVSFSLVVVVGLSYIAQVNHAATQGYRMRHLENEMTALTIQNEQLDYQVAELQSVESVTTRLKMLGLVETSTTHYASSATPSVALNR